MRFLRFLIVAILFGGQVHASESKIPEQFRGETAGAPVEINYEDWSLILKSTVVGVKREGRGKAVSASSAAPAGTRVARSNIKDTRNDGNRINFKLLAEPQNLETLTVIRNSLEQVPAEVPMKHWQKKEQLAYWLNLYNITLIEQLAKEYPFRKLKKMKSAKKGIWARKLLNVAGVPLSLNDIQHTILPNKWDTTLVMYGLFQGFIGGPSIQKTAFTRYNVHKLLIASAKEFVNSNRGMKVNGKALRVSSFYKENEALFPNWKVDIKKHVLSLSDNRMKLRVNNTSKIKTLSMDYETTDLFAGGTSAMTSGSTNAAALEFANQGKHDVAGAPPGSGSRPPVPIIHSLSNWAKQAQRDYRLPQATKDFILQMQKERAGQGGEVSVEEVKKGTSSSGSDENRN